MNHKDVQQHALIHDRALSHEPGNHDLQKSFVGFRAEREMALKPFDQISDPDPRYSEMMVIDAEGARPISLADHHGAIAQLTLSDRVPRKVRNAFDRALNVLVYAWYDYELLVAGESLALGAFELGLKARLNKPVNQAGGGLFKLIEDARKAGALPARLPAEHGKRDPTDALREIRNALAHGTTDVHSPEMALTVVRACRDALEAMFQDGSSGS